MLTLRRQIRLALLVTLLGCAGCEYFRSDSHGPFQSSNGWANPRSTTDWRPGAFENAE